ncbi:MAG: SDR family NAD(P)-dependent oxidoreductase [Trichodesmium sp. MO_231.B1]|nr:SDR family NAD(P)-dependent oxidoreductase [Trichodesmium sp. MO_231.B1]
MVKLNFNEDSVSNNSEVVELAELGNGVVQITMKDEENRNTLSTGVREGLSKCFGAVAQNKSYKVVILTGHGNYFCAGPAIEYLVKRTRREVGVIDLSEFLLACKIPIIAAMQGHAIGGGFLMGLYADFVVLSKESIYTINFMDYGFTPVGASSLILPEKLGSVLSQEMIYTGKKYRGQELAERGIPLPVVPKQDVLNHAQRLAQEIAKKPRLSIVNLKQLWTYEFRKKFPEVLNKELEIHKMTFEQLEVESRIKEVFDDFKKPNLSEGNIAEEKQKNTSSFQPLQLKISGYGLLKNLHWAPVERRIPKPTEVEVQLKAVALNFREILNALGLFNEENLRRFGISKAEELTFGCEGAATVVAVGSEVSQWQVGDEVIFRGWDLFSSFITCSADKLLAQPSNLSMIESATIPVSFFTAYYGLHDLAKIQPGDRVLIHAASGGAGQAAVKLAQYFGAEVFATTSQKKMSFVREQGVKHIMNSRTTEFADEVMEITQGRGVDIIFNSVTHGDHIQKNIDILAQGGRYLEIGKLNIWSHEEVSQRRPDVKYFPFDFSEEIERDDKLNPRIWESLLPLFESGVLQPLPYKVFPSEDVIEAFRYMQHSKHIGKIVVTMPGFSYGEEGEAKVNSYQQNNQGQMNQNQDILNKLQSGNISLDDAEQLLLGLSQEEEVEPNQDILNKLQSGNISLDDAEQLLLGLSQEEEVEPNQDILNKLQSGNISLDDAEQLLLGLSQEEEVEPKAIKQQINSDDPQGILSLLSTGEISLENAENFLLEESAKSQKKNDELTSVQNNIGTTDVAIIGISCRYPGAKNWQEFWENLKGGVDSVTEAPPGRWEEQEWYDPDPKNPRTSYSKSAGFIDEIDKFDPLFFQISPEEAQFIEPQQRIFLEEAYHAIEDAGYAADSLKGKQCGVFVGASTFGDYIKLLARSGLETNRLVGTGNMLSVVPARIAYFLDLKGPVTVIDTACSSSLVALHQACESIQSGESEMAIAGGIAIMETADFQILASQFQVVSPEGRCKTFDASASGPAWSEGCGVVLLKRLDQAIRDNDYIYGVVKGSGVNYDGNTNGISAPSGKSQVSLEEGVYRKFGINPETISYVEAHGTATPLGDPIEVEALTEVFSKWTSKKQFCPIGSVKTNIGHPSWAAGIAGLLKTVLCLKNQTLVPSLHFNKPNPHIDFDNSPFYVNTELRDWEIETGKPRRATVSSFGFSGTNAHIVLEEAPSQVKSQKSKASPLPPFERGEKRDDLEDSVNILTLSAKTETSLSELVKSYQSYIKNNPELRIGDICYTANTGRTHFNYRLAVVGSNQEELVEKLQQHQEGEKVAGISSTAKTAFLFTGQGSQYVNMGRKLYEQSPIFREAINQCDDILRTLETFKEKSLPEIIYPADDSSDSSILNQTAYTQPCLFAIEYALYKLWQSWGIQPDAVMGHSVGEYVAATVAGVFSLEDGLKLISARGRLMQQLPAGGEMISVMTSESKVLETLKAMSLEEKVAIAAINGPESIVISGEGEAVRAIATKLESAGVKTKQLDVSHAFHSHLMEPMLAEFAAVANQITYNLPQIKLISNVTGKLVDAEITSAEYWVNHVRQAVRFADSMITLHQQGYNLFLEIGPKPILLGMGRRCLPQEVGVWLPSLRSGVDEWQSILSSLGQLYVNGYKVNWLQFYQGYNHEKVVLPTYPFQRERYWVEASSYQQKPYWSTANNKNLHPLLGEKINLAGLENQYRFQSHFTAQSPSYLSDHKVFSKVIFPGTGYLEIATSVGKNLFTNQEQVVVSEVHILRGLVLPETEVKTVQIVATPVEDNNSYKFEIFSSSEGENQQKPEWMLHTKGKIYTDPTANSQTKIDLEKYQAECNQVIEIKEHYQECSSRGIDYGSTFQGIKKLWKGEGKALGEIILSEELTAQLADYQLHPALLDSAFQMILYAITETETDKTYLPVGVEKFKVYGQTISHVWAIVEIRENSLTADIHLVDNEGTLLAEIEGLRITPTTASALLKSLQPDISHWFYEIKWQAQPLPADSPSAAATGKWLVLAKDTELVTALTDKGHECIRVSPGDKYEQISPQHYQINPTNGEEFKQLLEENPGIGNIVHLWSWQSTEIKEVLELENIQAQNCASALHLVQATLNSKPETVPQLWLITQGSQSVISDSEVINPEYGSLWGLGQIITLEHPELRCKRIDFDRQSTQNLDSLIAELLSEDFEDQIGIRQGSRYVARLEQKRQQDKITDTQPVKLKLSEYGSIDNLKWQSMQRRLPEAKEVEIEVVAVGLNLRDVLNSLGLLKDYYAEHLGVNSVDKLTFGFECAGKISAVGAEVSEWQVGDEVMLTMIHDGFSSFITAPAEYVMAKPKSMSFNEAATLPLTFVTAYYGLQKLAKIKAGDRVLIHSAAGGVGQAAVQIAQLAGAEIFATASPGKWDFLKSMGIKHIMNSRTLDFAKEIKEITGGEGVDVVLNSLNGDHIPYSFEALAPKGRFVEIGKIGIWDEKQVEEKRPDISYYPFDLGDVVKENPGIMGEISEELTQEWNEGKLRALPYKVFSNTEITTAFRYMQQAKHIGKIVVEMPQLLDEPKSIQAEGSYLITGGLGALGLEVAQWMVTQGAKNIVLTGRSAPKETAQEIIDELETAGAKISVLLGDVSKQEDVAKMFQEMEASLPPLKGVIHSAGVLDDGVLRNLTWQQFTKVMSPKITGTWHLHQMTKDLPLDFFICFSSMAAMLGNAGQGNYAAANAYMDAIAHYRRSQRLPGLSINWGAWTAGGMAARLAGGHQNRIQGSGVMAIEPQQGMQALELLLSGASSQVGVLPVNWSEFFGQMPMAQKMPLLSGFVSSAVSATETIETKILEQLKESSPEERDNILVDYFKGKLAGLLGITASKIDADKPLTAMGLDSLMAVELRNLVQRELGFDIPIEKIIEGISITQIVNLVVEQLLLEQISYSNSSQTTEENAEDMEEITL